MTSIRTLSETLQQKAKDELNEVPERIDEDLKALKDWIAKQPHLKARTDDQFLIAFLRGSKYSLERAKEKIDMFYTVRTAMTESFTNRDPKDPKISEVIKIGTFLPMPNLITPDGSRVFLIRPGAYDANKYTIQDVMTVTTMLMDILFLEDDNLIVSGQSGVLDLSNATVGHLLQMTPAFMKKMTMLGQEASPLRQKGFHYINTPPGFEKFYNAFKSFMSEKNRRRLYVHGDKLEELYKHIPKSLLPTEYGGEAGPLQNIIDHWEKKLNDYRDYFLEEANFGTDEKKRTGPPKNAEALFGAEGSFRKLNVD